MFFRELPNREKFEEEGYLLLRDGVEAYHILNEDWSFRYGLSEFKAKQGLVLPEIQELLMCSRGYHAGSSLAHAKMYVPQYGQLAKVRVYGLVIVSSSYDYDSVRYPYCTKFCASNRVVDHLVPEFRYRGAFTNLQMKVWEAYASLVEYLLNELEPLPVFREAGRWRNLLKGSVEDFLFKFGEDERVPYSSASCLAKMLSPVRDHILKDTSSIISSCSVRGELADIVSGVFLLETLTHSISTKEDAFLDRVTIIVNQVEEIARRLNMSWASEFKVSKLDNLFCTLVNKLDLFVSQAFSATLGHLDFLSCQGIENCYPSKATFKAPEEYVNLKGTTVNPDFTTVLVDEDEFDRCPMKYWAILQGGRYANNDK